MMMPGEKAFTTDEGFWQSSLTLLEPCAEEALVLQFCITETERNIISTRLDLVYYLSDTPGWREEIPLDSVVTSMQVISSICKARGLPVDVAVKAQVLIPAAVSIKRASEQIC